MIFYCCVHNRSPRVSAPRQINPVHGPVSNFFKTPYNVLLPLSFPHQNPIRISYFFPYVLPERTILPPAFYHQKF